MSYAVYKELTVTVASELGAGDASTIINCELAETNSSTAEESSERLKAKTYAKQAPQLLSEIEKTEYKPLSDCARIVTVCSDHPVQDRQKAT